MSRSEAPMTESNAIEAPRTGASAGDLHGRVDAIDRGRVFGWVWNPAQPEQRITVRICWGGGQIAEVIADQPRIDLRRNGIGDGQHAFDVELPDDALSAPERLSVVAVAPETGEECPLHIPSAAERASEAAVTVPMGQVLDRLDRMLLAQHRIQKVQREVIESLRDATHQLKRKAAPGTSEEDGAAQDGAGQDDILARLQELEVFLMRIDGTLGGFDERLGTLGARAQGGLKAPMLLLAAAGGLIVGLTVSMIVGL